MPPTIHTEQTERFIHGQADSLRSVNQSRLVRSPAIACIFCGSQVVPQSTSHIVPESLGGPHSPIAPPGITCDACNQYFGQKVESFALRSFPFIGYRLLESIPSKKNRMVSLPTSLGVIRASGTPGRIELESRCPQVEQLVIEGRANSFRIVAEVTEALAVCRMLLKIGLELLGKHFYEVAISERVRNAREFARRPKPRDRWWFIIHSDPSVLFNAHPDFSVDESGAIEIIEHEDRLISILRLRGVTTMIPLEDGTLPPNQQELPEPAYRIVWARC
jgi:hypothetical protein